MFRRGRGGERIHKRVREKVDEREGERVYAWVPDRIGRCLGGRGGGGGRGVRDRDERGGIRRYMSG